LAGFTSGLLCVVWVGFNDNRELDLTGAESALPIWTEFMKRAAQRHGYAGQPGAPPPGIVTARIDPETGQAIGPFCPGSRTEYFVAGSEPDTICTRHLETNEQTPPQSPANVALGSRVLAAYPQ
jgi:penicillin-binding protein 1B